MCEVEAKVRAWLLELRGSDESPLDLDSFEVIELIERAERELGVRVQALELAPEHFETPKTIAALLGRQGA